MSNLIGKIDEFNGTKEDWTQYVERVDHFFAANEITDDSKKKSAFLAVIGPTTYTLVRNLVSPAKPGEKSYDELVKALKDHFNPTPSETVQRSRFHNRVRKPGESVATFVAELRSLAEFCNFGAVLDDMLRDRLICGINNSKIQQKLLAEKKLTLTSAIETAQGMETAARNAKEMAQQDNGESVHRVTSSTRGKDTGSTKSKFKGTCFCCGRVGHKRENCHFKDAICRGCGKTGHTQKVCRSKPGAKRKSKPAERKPVHHLEESGEDSSSDSTSEDYALYSITSSSKQKPY